MSEFSSTKSSSVSSSKKVSVSSKISSSSSISKSSFDSDDLSREALLSNKSSGRSLSSKLSTELDHLESLMGSTSLNKSSLGQISAQSSVDGQCAVKSSVKSHSSSSSTSASLSQRIASVDGQVVSAETAADRSSKKKESGKEKTIEDGIVTLNTGYNVQQTKEAKLRATKEMSKDELDSFFRQPAITSRTPEALDFDKNSNSFETKLLDLPQFSPQDLTVRIVDGIITVVGYHEEVDEHGTVRSHNYIKRFTVPKDLKADNVEWELEPSGVLSIKAGDYVIGKTSQAHLDCTIFKPRSFFKTIQE